MNNMSDMSFTQTSRAMTSSPLNRSSNTYKPWWEVVSLNNAKRKVVRRHVCRDNSVFTSL